jgi:hypothetical protein
MSNGGKPVSDHPFDDGFVGSGRPLGAFLSPISDEDVRRLEEAWNDPKFYNLAMEEGVVTAGWVPKPTVDLHRKLVPSPKEMAKLPRWAQVAFAARCARRVLPIMVAFLANAPSQHLQALERAVHVAENAGACTMRDAGEAILAAGTINGAGAPFAAAAAAAAALTGGNATGAVSDALTGATYLLYQVGTIGTVELLAAPARDFDRLLRLAEKEKWTDDTPVPQSVFGPMWEGPPPEWWTDDVLAGLPAEPATETNTLANGHPTPTEDAVAPQ